MSTSKKTSKENEKIQLIPVYVIKHSELFLKPSKYKKLEQWLERDVKRALSLSNLQGSIKRKRGRIYFFPKALESNKEKIFSTLKNVFGVSSVAFGYKLKDSSEEEIKQALSFILSKQGKNKTYKIEVNRADKSFPVPSIAFAKKLAKELEKQGFVLSVKNPGFIVELEIREEGVFILLEKRKAYGGFPYGTEGRAILLFSAGFDSVISLFLSARKGVKVIPLSIYSTPQSLEQTAHIYEIMKKKFFLRAPLYISRLPEEFFLVKESLRQSLFKIYLYKLAERFAKQKKALAIITGESLSQTHSQTLRNLSLYSSFVSVEIFRPVLGLTKEEIIEKVRELSLYKEVEKVKEFCILTKKPNIFPSKEALYKEWSKLSHLVEKVEIKRYEGVKKAPSLTLSKSKELIFLDLNKKEHLKLVINEKLSKDKQYVLYCPSGVTASFFAEKLRKKGYSVIALSKEKAIEMKKRMEKD